MSVKKNIDKLKKSKDGSYLDSPLSDKSEMPKQNKVSIKRWIFFAFMPVAACFAILIPIVFVVLLYTNPAPLSFLGIKQDEVGKSFFSGGERYGQPLTYEEEQIKEMLRLFAKSFQGESSMNEKMATNFKNARNKACNFFITHRSGVIDYEQEFSSSEMDAIKAWRKARRSAWRDICNLKQSNRKTCDELFSKMSRQELMAVFNCLK